MPYLLGHDVVPVRLVREPGIDGVVHQIRRDTWEASYQARTICDVSFYYSDNQYLWHDPPHDKPWWTRVKLQEEKRVTCLLCLARSGLG